MGRKRHSVNMMFIVLLLGIFALTTIFAAVMGADVYANSAEKMQANFDTRTSIVYLSEKIRTCPGDNYDIRELDGSSALVFSQEFDGIVNESWVFVYKGELCEANVFAGDIVMPDVAQRIMPLQSFDAELKSGGIEVTAVTMAGDINTTFISSRTGI